MIRTMPKFCAALKAKGREWRFQDKCKIIAIAPYCCPLGAFADGGFPTKVRGMTNALCARVWRAADNTGDARPSDRRALLRACGLKENKKP